MWFKSIGTCVCVIKQFTKHSEMILKFIFWRNVCNILFILDRKIAIHQIY